LYNSCFNTSYFILRLWLYEHDEVEKAKGNLLKPKLLGLTVSKNLGTSLTLPQGSTENMFLLPFQNSLILNNKAEIILSDAVGTNGVIHVINQILVPSHMQDFPLKKVRAAHCRS